MSDYKTDILSWSEHQAALLRRRAAGEAVDDAELDWAHIAATVEEAGQNRLHSVESLLVQALQHVLKAESWPFARDAAHWRTEADEFRAQARSRLTASMQGRIDLARLYAEAVAAMPASIKGQPPRPMPPECPVTLDQLLSDDAGPPSSPPSI